MNRKIVIIAPALIAVTGSIAYVISFYGSEAALIDRFPDIDYKIVVKVHRQMFRDALRGKMSDVPNTDEAMDEIFLARVQELIAS